MEKLKKNKGTTGGLIGNLKNASIKNCHSKGKIIGNNTDGGISSTGGLIGNGVGGTKIIIENSYNEASVKGYSRVGGICGSLRTQIYNSYNKGNVEGDDSVGGIVGYSAQMISNCYNEGIIRTTSSSAGGIAGCIYAGSNQNI